MFSANRKIVLTLKRGFSVGRFYPQMLMPFSIRLK